MGQDPTLAAYAARQDWDPDLPGQRAASSRGDWNRTAQTPVGMTTYTARPSAAAVQSRGAPGSRTQPRRAPSALKTHRASELTAGTSTLSRPATARAPSSRQDASTRQNTRPLPGRPAPSSG